LDFYVLLGLIKAQTLCVQLCDWAHIFIKNKIIKGEKIWLFLNQLKMPLLADQAVNVNVHEVLTDILDDAPIPLKDMAQNITILFRKMLVVLMDLKTVRLFVLLVTKKRGLMEVINHKIYSLV